MSVALVVDTLTRGDARTLTEEVKRDAAVLRAKLLRLYEGRAYAPNAERKRIGALVRAPNRSMDRRYRRRDQLAERRRRRAAQAEAGQAVDAQTSLF